ncbi:DUF418 domain-containing protein [Sphingobacterium kitahiroshimense]|uniref:DUF418 domain-containing protein n=1 Tax=Sphingobacterium kitahiroshimense TaxID=470446 RepID=A0ABV0BSL5_9SPHI
MNRIIKENRIQIIDILRGFALSIIIFMNFESIMKIPFNEAGRDLYHVMNVLFKGKGYTLFSFLFGYGTFIFMENAYKKGLSPALCFFKRIVFLFVVGFLHRYLQAGEALTYYAVFGLFLLPSYKLDSKYIFCIATLFFVVSTIAAAQIFGSLGMIFCGFGISKMNFFSIYMNKKYSKQYLLILALFVVLSILGYFWIYKYIYIYHINYLSKAMFIGGILQSIAYTLLVILLYLHSSIFKRLLYEFAYLGRMSLTNYLMQTIMLFVLAYFYPGTTYLQGIHASIAVLFLQYVYSKFYLIKIDSVGPFEKIWRKFKYYDFKKLIGKTSF